MSDKTEAQDEHKLIAERRKKLNLIREKGQAFPNDFKRDSLASDLHAEYDNLTKEELDKKNIKVRVAGRMLAKRVMGKASFAQIRDMSGKIQVFAQMAALPQGVYDDYKTWDVGDIVAGSGVLFKTKTDELSVRLGEFRLLTKSVRPLPEKFHGLTDTEERYRKRYLDLIMNEDSRQVFLLRSQIINYVREFLNNAGFLEVETPMMHVIPGGATAKPFATYHNSLDMELYLRIAPELFLKRLIVGGFEKVYEINRSFRNEGLSTRHNPEFTMVEFYAAFHDYLDFIELTENMVRSLALKVMGDSKINYEGTEYDFAEEFRRMTVKEAILHFNPELAASDIEDLEKARAYAEKLNISVKDSYGLGKVQIEIFEKTVEHQLKDPTFITQYPAEVSPLARRNDKNPFVTDRFEFFVGGREIANGFSELNDYEDQAERFKTQLAEKEAGDEEAMHYDADYIEALEYAMPPAAGEGIGIDRLVMLFTDSPSIRDVLLFPHMRPKV